MDPALTSQEDDIPGTIPKTVLPGIPEWVRSSALCGAESETDHNNRWGSAGKRLQASRARADPTPRRPRSLASSAASCECCASRVQAVRGDTDWTSKEQYYGQWYHNAGIVSVVAPGIRRCEGSWRQR